MPQKYSFSIKCSQGKPLKHLNSWQKKIFIGYPILNEKKHKNVECSETK